MRRTNGGTSQCRTNETHHDGFWMPEPGSGRIKIVQGHIWQQLDAVRSYLDSPQRPYARLSTFTTTAAGGAS